MKQWHHARITNGSTSIKLRADKWLDIGCPIEISIGTKQVWMAMKWTTHQSKRYVLDEEEEFIIGVSLVGLLVD